MTLSGARISISHIQIFIVGGETVCEKASADILINQCSGLTHHEGGYSSLGLCCHCQRSTFPLIDPTSNCPTGDPTIQSFP